MILKICFAVLSGLSLVGLVGYFLLYSPQTVVKQPVTNVDSLFPTISNEAVNQRQPGTILTTNFGVIVSDEALVKNIKATEIEAGFYEMTDDPKAYGIYYLADGGNVTVNLYGADTKSSRLAAEKYLLSTLKFTKEQLCSVVVQVVTNEYENPELAGRSLGLSFCPGALAL